MHSCVLRSHSSLLDDQLIQLKLHGLLLDHLFFHGVLSDESVDLHLFLLANSMSSVHRLKIHLRIPVTVIENYSIC